MVAVRVREPGVPASLLRIQPQVDVGHIDAGRSEPYVHAFKDGWPVPAVTLTGVTRTVCAFLLLALCAAAQPKRVLYVTHSAGFRHDSIQVSIPVLRSLSPQLEITHTE